MFNLFKRKREQVPAFQKPKTVLCIPGNWKDRTELLTAIAINNVHEYLFAGHLLVNLKTKVTFEIEIYERDEQLRKAFKYAGMVNRVSEDFLNGIDRHTQVIYLLAETGSTENAKAIAEAANALLKAGGTGIKVESAGKAFTKEQWQELLLQGEEPDLYKLFVLDSISNHNSVYSCGMHNLGLKDTIVYGEEFQQSVQLISIFSGYQLLEKPVILPGQTFSISTEAPVFRTFEEEKRLYKSNELFYNPYGMWKLVRV